MARKCIEVRPGDAVTIRGDAVVTFGHKFGQRVRLIVDAPAETLIEHRRESGNPPKVARKHASSQ